MKGAALAARDVALAKLVHRWEGELLGVDASEGGGAEVIDLRKRGPK